VELKVSVKDKTFRKNGSSSHVLRNVAFTVPESTIVCLYGPSGCGKSTLLRILAGLDTDYVGEVLLDGQPVLSPTQSIGLTVQSLVSFDWLTVKQNIVFGLRYASQPRTLTSWFGRIMPTVADAEASRLADIVGLSWADLQKYPNEVSGGMKQRMAFARALLPGPKVLLLDEPFSSLDYDSRQSLQELVLDVRRRLGTTFICVTHDPEEALFLADSIFVMSASPSTISCEFSPDLPFKGSDESRYTAEFQQAKKTLHGLLASPTSSTAKGYRVATAPSNIVRQYEF
jgi:NitT/TauT family transport system ATP-binding protein